MPDISALTEGKKGKAADKGVVSLKGGKKDEDFSDYGFKEGNTHVLKMQDIFIKEKGKAALQKLKEAPVVAPARVKGGAKGKKKAVAKGSAKSASVKKQTGKILKYTPSKVTAEGKKSQKKRTPAMPSPGGKKSALTTDKMTMDEFKKYLEWHEKKKGVKKTLGKRSAGKASTSSKKK